MLLYYWFFLFLLYGEYLLLNALLIECWCFLNLGSEAMGGTSHFWDALGLLYRFLHFTSEDVHELVLGVRIELLVNSLCF